MSIYINGVEYIVTTECCTYEELLDSEATICAK